MNNLDPKLVTETLPTSGITLLGVTMGAWFARLILGRHLKSLDKVVKLSEDTHKTVMKIDSRVSKIEGRLEQMDRKI